VVRLLNVFRLRLSDCRGEVKLEELLMFVLLELVSPEAVELVRTHSTLFLGALSHHPEFSMLAADSETGRLFRKEGEIREQKAKLFDELEADNRQVARHIVEHVFSESADQDARTASSPHGLIKLLYGGGSPLSFSVKEVVEFREDRERDRIVWEKVSAAVLREWLVFSSSIPNVSALKNPRSMAKLLIDVSLDVEDRDNVHSIHRLIGEYLTELLELMDEKERLPFLYAIVKQRKNLAVAEDVVLRLSRMAGLWAQGESFPIGEKPVSAEWKDIVPIDEIPKLQAAWLDEVRMEAAADRLQDQPLLASILHRWGQFNNNEYAEVHEYFTQFSAKHDPTLIFRHFPLAVSLDGLEKIVADPTAARAALKRYQEQPELRELALKAVEHVERKQKQPDAVGHKTP
jgi:hypothetical protein